MILNRKVLKFEIDLDFILIAVTISLKDYRVCYFINKHLHFNFSRQADLAIDISPNAEPAYFSLYHDYHEAGDTSYYLIANKGTGGYLIPEMSRTDYFLMIKYFIDDEELDNILTGLNRIPEIVAAAKIDPKKLKSRENLLF